MRRYSEDKVAMKWCNEELDPDDEDQLVEFFAEFASVIAEKRRFFVNGQVKHRCFSSHVRLIAALIVHYRYYAPSFLLEETKGRVYVYGIMKRGTLLEFSAIHHKKRYPKVVKFLRKLDKRHSFLINKGFRSENARQFLETFDVGIALEGLRSRFRKYKVWWKDGHEFGSNRGGIPYKWKMYLKTIRVHLGKDAYN